MLRSMTGFGRYENVTDAYKISVEMKAVNHRYLDLSIKMPKKFNYFEASIRTLLKKYIQRGKVDLFITYEDHTGGDLCLKYDRDLAAEYMAAFEQMAQQFGLKEDVTVSTLAKCPEVLTMEQVPEDEEHLWRVLSEGIQAAAERFVETRIGEGENLKEDLIKKLDYMAELVRSIEERSPMLLEEYRRKLTEKVTELLNGAAIDESRVVTEVTIYADKICTDEEMVRLKSHIEMMKSKLIAGGSIGRELDFIAQEMNREANTTLSKANDLEIADKAIALKTEIEKIREQIQKYRVAVAVPGPRSATDSCSGGRRWGKRGS